MVSMSTDTNPEIWKWLDQLILEMGSVRADPLKSQENQ
jgi:hypothetical protein